MGKLGLAEHAELRVPESLSAAGIGLRLRPRHDVCENPSWFIAGLYCSSDLRRRRGLAMKLDQHVALPSRASVRTQRAMKSADRRGAM